ncbi:MAG: serine/threonine-protein kinase, partial [Rhodothermia bacterium]|nr:serine/threonine-protein kinase [Rhodothermia bacterium]
MTPGTIISHYRVVDQLGRGGMGIVYKAEDTKLDRTVALKLLPPHALVSEDDRARFYREARAAAALNHANIAHVYEIDEAAVENGESRPFIAMEYIDGDSLSEVIQRGPLPLKDAINYASQIAEGLKVAHEANIVHRDIKSGNVMLTSKGVVKILDFGLAKTAASTKLTQMGSTLGTVAYMSPEQARGEEVDRRSDIWSAGVILYEMITGQMPFPGDYEQAIVYGILNEDPESLTALRAGVPMALDGIMAKLLTKDPDLRYQHIDELPADLKAIDLGSAVTRSRISTGSRSAITPAQPSAIETASRPARRPPWYAHPVAIGAAALLFGAAMGFLLRQPPEVPKPVRYLSLPTHGIRDATNPTISPDGEYIAFAGTDTSAQSETLFIYETSTGRMHGFTGTIAEPEWMSFSPNGRWLLYNSPAGVYRLLVPDGQPIMISSKFETAAWESDESLIIAWETVRRISASGGEQDTLARLDSTAAHNGLFAPRMLGASGQILVTAPTPDGNWDLARVDLETGKYEVLVERAAAGHYLPTGHLLYIRNLEGSQDAGALAIQPFDLETMSFSGSPVPVPVGEQEWYHFGFGLDGTLIYTDFTE